MTMIAVYGGGTIGEALTAGLVAAGHTDVTVINRRAERSAYFRETYGVRSSEEPADGAADIVFIAVKPYAVTEVLRGLAPHLAEGATVVSLAAGVTLAQLAEAAPGAQVIRVMPNTPMLARMGMCAIAPAPGVDTAAVEELLQAVGETVVIEEKDMDAVTALSGSSPAYVYLFAEALVDAGVARGLSRTVASKLAIQSIRGAGEMLAGTKTPTQLRYDVTSPGGTTAAALRALEDGGLRSAVFSAVDACAERNRELGKPD